MYHRIAWAIAPVLATAGLFAVPTTPAPVPGPGAVIDAVRGFLEATDAGDRQALERALITIQHEVRCGVDEKGAIKELPPSGAELFFQDVLGDGKVVTAKDGKGALALLCDSIGGKARNAKSRIKSINADCPGPQCSWAQVEFERSFAQGDRVVTVPMSATVLVRYRETEPHMGIFLWHASARPEPAKAK
jgi:hypothetical protein